MDTNVVIAFLTGVIAIATIVYVVLTARLWKETKKSADAATKSAEAAKKSADGTAALYRPFIGLESLPTERLSSNTIWEFPSKLWNYGTLPASHLSASFAFYTESAQKAATRSRPLKVRVRRNLPQLRI